MVAQLRAAGLEPTSVDRIVNVECSKERPDALYDLGHTVLIVECDERQHKSATRQVEQCRMRSLSQHFGQARVLFLRFNPDGYKSTGAQASLQQRYDTLVRLVREILGGQYATPRAHLAVLYLYYDGWKSLADEQWEILESTSLDYDELGQALSSLSLAQASSSGY